MSILDAGGNRIQLGLAEATILTGADGSGTVTEEVDSEVGLVATVPFQCRYADRFEVYKGLAGGTFYAGGVVVRYLPFAYPPSPSLYCMGISGGRGVKLASSEGWPAWKLWQFQAKFQTPAWGIENGDNDPSGEPWTTTRVRVSAEVTEVPLGTFLWTSGSQSGQQVPESGLGILVPRNEISMTRHWVPYVPLADVNGYIGTLNNSPIVMSDYTYPKGYVLFAGFNATESVDTLGNRTYEIEYVLLGSTTHDWNKLLAKDMVYRYVNTAADASGSYPFGYSEFYNNLP